MTATPQKNRPAPPDRKRKLSSALKQNMARRKQAASRPRPAKREAE